MWRTLFPSALFAIGLVLMRHLAGPHSTHMQNYQLSSQQRFIIRTGGAPSLIVRPQQPQLPHSSPISVLQTVPSPLIQLNLHNSYGKYIFLLRLVSSMCYTLYLTGFFNTPIWRLICFPWFTVGFCVVDGFLQVSSFRWIHCFHDFILMNSPFKWSHVFLSLGLFSCWDRLDEFIVFVNSLHEFIFYMNPYILSSIQFVY